MNNHFVEYRLDNGLRIVIEPMRHVRSVACGFLARTGSRDESPEQAGISHFLEHMCFKGTPRRDWRQITLDFDRLGAYYNAFTSRDHTFYYGWVRATDFEPILELLADMMCSTIPPDAFETERSVILEEIAQAHDSLDHLIYDVLHEQALNGHPLAWPILGYERTIRSLPREAMLAYHRHRYAPNNLVLIVAGNVDPPRVLEAARRYCGQWTPAECPRRREPPPFRPGRLCRVVERFRQQAVALAWPAPGATDAFYETANATAAILGGSNSRIYWNVVQKGLCASATAMYVPYEDRGLMIIGGICDPQQCEEFTAALRDQARSLSTDGAEEREVQRVRNRRRTALAAEAEAPYYRLVQLMDDVDYRGQPRTAEERLAAVQAVTPQRVHDYLRAFPVTGEGCFVSVGPRDWTPP